MQPIDIEEVKRISAKLGRRKLTQARMPLKSPTLTERERAIHELLRSYLAKTGFPVDELNKLRAAVSEERRKLLDTRETETAKNLAADEIVLRQGLENFRQAAMLLAQPFQSRLVTLAQPFLIWQYPHPQLDIFIDSGIAPNNSFIKVKVDVHTGSDDTYFVFHFLWTNQSEFPAVISAKTSLIFNGFGLVEADSDLLDANHESEIQLGAAHRIWRWSGWGNDPVSGQSLDQTLLFDYFSHSVTPDLSVAGGGLFGDVGFATQEFNFQPFFLNTNPIAVPPSATIMYQVAVHLYYEIKVLLGGKSQADEVSLDFATDILINPINRRIICPGAVLEVSTPLQSAST